jgi:hypothetical protein
MERLQKFSRHATEMDVINSTFNTKNYMERLQKFSRHATPHSTLKKSMERVLVTKTDLDLGSHLQAGN